MPYQYDPDDEEAPLPDVPDQGVSPLVGPQPENTAYQRFRRDFDTPISQIQGVGNALGSAANYVTSLSDKMPQNSLQSLWSYLQGSQSTSPTSQTAAPSKQSDPSKAIASITSDNGPGLVENSSMLTQNTDPVTDLLGMLQNRNSTPVDQGPMSTADSRTPASESAGSNGKGGSRATSGSADPKAENGLMRDLFLPQNDLGSVNNLRAAQSQAAGNELVNRLGKAGEVAGAALSHTQPVNQKSWDQAIAGSNQPVQDYLQQVAQQKDDPNSALSQAFRQYAQNLGVKIHGDLSAADAEKIVPFIFKGFEAQQQRDMKDKEFGIQQQNLMQRAKEHNDMMALLKQNTMDLQHQKINNQIEKGYEDSLNQLKSKRGLLGNPVAKIQMADTLESMLNDPKYKNLDEVPENMKNEFISAYNNMVTGGQGSNDKFNKLLAKTGVNNAAKFWQYMTNNPTAARQGGFIQMFRDSARRQAQIADAQVKDATIEHLKNYQDRLTPGFVQLQLDSNGIAPTQFQNWKPKMFHDMALGMKSPAFQTMAQQNGMGNVGGGNGGGQVVIRRKSDGATKLVPQAAAGAYLNSPDFEQVQ